MRNILIILFLSCTLLHPYKLLSQETNSQLITEIDSIIKHLPSNPNHLNPSDLRLLNTGINNIEKKDQLEFLNKLGTYYYQNELLDSANSYFNKGFTVAKEIGDRYNQAIFSYKMSQIHITFAEYKEALQDLNYANEIYSNQDSALFNCDIALLYGNLYWNMSLFEKSIEYYLKSLEIAEEHDLKIKIIALYNNIGLVYSSVGDYENYIHHLRKAYEISLKYNNKSGVLVSTNNIGEYFYSKEQYDSALYYFKLSEKLASEYGRKLHQGITLYNQGSIYLEQDSTELARSLINKSLAFAYETKDLIGVSNCLLVLGESYLKENKPDIAFPMIDSGLITAKMVSSFSLQETAYSLKAEYFKQKGDIELALENMEIQMSIKDSIFEKEKAENIARIEYKYFEDQVAKELNNIKQKRNVSYFFIAQLLLALFVIILIIFISLRKSRRTNKQLSIQNIEIEKQQKLLQQKNKELTATQKELEELVYAKDRFITIISHDLKNPVSAMRGFIELMISRYDSISEDKKKLFLKQVLESIEKTSLLINNVLYWVRSQTHGIINRPEEIKLHKRVKQNISLYTIIANEKKINIQNDVSEKLILSVDPNIFDTIVRNLLSNSIKFTEQNGSIIFEAEESTDSIKLTLKDSGLGIKKEKINSILFDKDVDSTPGTNHEQGTGLGLGLIKEFSSYLNVEFTIDSIEGQGSVFTLLFPKLTK